MSDKQPLNLSVRDEDAPWRHYPHFDAALASDTPAVLASMEKTRLELDALVRGGTGPQRERARAALAAYDKALELYHVLADLRSKTVRAPSNTRAGMPITE